MTRKRLTTAGFLILVLLALVFHFFRVFVHMDNGLLAWQFQSLRDHFPRSIDNDVVIVGIDEQTFFAYPEPLALWHPHLGKFFHAMAIARPSVVGVDLVMPEKSYDFVREGIDRELLQGLLRLKTASPVVLGQTLDATGRVRPLFAPIMSVLDQNAFGLVMVMNDADGIIRRFDSSIRFTDDTVPTLAALMAARTGVEPESGYINYSIGNHFSYIPMQQVNQWYEDDDETQLRKLFSDRPVLIGSVLPFDDRHDAPVPLYVSEKSNPRVPGIFIHAQILRSVLAGQVLQPISPVIALLLLYLALLFYWFGHKPLVSVPLFLVFTYLLISGSTFILWQGRILPVMTSILVAAMAILGRLGLEGVYTILEKRRLQASFGRYVSPNVLEQILTGEINPAMVGERKRICVLFSDIRNFTTRSESQPPEAIIALLNSYFNEMTSVIHAHGGTVDKYIGDGLMAFFGAPNQLKNPAQQAFLAATQMLNRLEVLNLQLKPQDIEEIHIGIGLHLGDAVVGHVGSTTRHEYTVIGDTVNLAARLEGKSRDLGYPVICSTSVAHSIELPEQLVPLGKTNIKGRADEQVFGWRPDIHRR